MKLFGMALHKLTLSISLLAASLMLAAPAQAETWTCAFINPNTQKPEKLAIVRDGGTFIEQFNKTPYRILNETENTIQLFFVGDVYPDMHARLLKPLTLANEYHWWGVQTYIT